MNHHLKPFVTAIGAIAFSLPFTAADLAWSQAPTDRQIAVEPSDEKKPADAAAKEDAPAKKAEEAADEKKSKPETDKAEAKKQAAPADAEKAEGKKEAASAEPDKTEAKKQAAPAATGKAEAKKDAAPAEPGKAEAKKDAAPAEPGKAEAKKDAAPGEPGKAEAKKDAAPAKPSARDLALALQTELKRVGCYYGALDGVWGPRSRAALHAFGYFGKVKTNNFNPSEAWIGRVKGKSKTVCAGDYRYGGPPQRGYGPGYGGPPPGGGYRGGYGGGGYGRY